MKFDTEIVQLVDQVISEFGNFDLDIREDSFKSDNEVSNYLKGHRHEYIRTISDIKEHFEGQKNINILEIGAFFGVVCICLARLGFHVTASDVPEYMSLPEQKERFSKEGISIHEMRLQDYVFDQPNNTYDAIIMCEVLEHLNFNPLPLIKEINRITKKSGIFYVALPNAASIYNRFNMIQGKMIGIEIDDFFDQLDPKSPIIANGHWREYTAKEIRSMLQKMGYSIKKQYYFSLGECQRSNSIRKRLARLFYSTFPYFKENQTTLAVKDKDTEITFNIPATVHPTLGKL